MKKICICAVALMGLFSTITVVEAANQDYTNYIVYANQYNTYTKVHSKQTNDNYAKNQITKLTVATTMNFSFWNSSTNKVTNTYKCKNGETKTAYLLSGKNMGKGSKIQLAMCNASASTKSGNVSGKVDFR